MRALLRFARRVDWLSDRVGTAVSWLVLLMILIGAFNAVARYVGRFTGWQLSSNAYLELQWYLFSLVFLLGAAHALRRDSHVRVDVVFARLSARARSWIELLGSLLFLLPFCVFALVSSWPSVRNSWAILEMSSDPGGLPRYPIKSVILVAFALLLLQGLAQAIKHLAELRGVDLDSEGRT
jgi:TRAP-type mannitol/chloroaromatic compound transport system permease small subunit